jgi:hypothetical protein
VILIGVWLISSLASAHEDDVEASMQRRMAPPAHAPAAADPDDEDSARTAPAPTPAPPPAQPEISKTAAKILLALIGMGVFGLVGLVYLPMATLANVVMGSPWTCFNFPFVFHSIGSATRDYLICLACYFGVVAGVGAIEFLAHIAGIMLTGFAIAFIELYGMTMLMRLLGLFYRMNQAKLGWMAD